MWLSQWRGPQLFCNWLILLLGKTVGLGKQPSLHRKVPRQSFKPCLSYIQIEMFGLERRHRRRRWPLESLSQTQAITFIQKLTLINFCKYCLSTQTYYSLSIHFPYMRLEFCTMGSTQR